MYKSFFILSFFLGFVGLAAQDPIKNYSFKNQNGADLQLHDIKGNYIFVSFVYTRCPVAKMCPLTISLNKSVFKLWKKKAPSIPLKFLIVTLDPANDTPATMKKYGDRFNLDSTSFILATGEEQALSDFSSEFNAIGFPSSGLISHNSRSILVDPDLVPLKNYNDNEWKAETVVKDLQDFALKRPKKP